MPRAHPAQVRFRPASDFGAHLLVEHDQQTLYCLGSLGVSRQDADIDLELRRSSPRGKERTNLHCASASGHSNPCGQWRVRSVPSAEFSSFVDSDGCRVGGSDWSQRFFCCGGWIWTTRPL